MISSRDNIGRRVGESEGNEESQEGRGNGMEEGSDTVGEGVGSSGISLLENPRRSSRRNCALVRVRRAKRSVG